MTTKTKTRKISLVFCNEGCADGYAADKANGLVYGNFDRLNAAVGCCSYCGSLVNDRLRCQHTTYNPADECWHFCEAAAAAVIPGDRFVCLDHTADYDRALLFRP